MTFQDDGLILELSR